ncbi:LAME_0H05424g1_1 [Lachancea meyersii CBS 8951]|uniref:Cytoplasmic tRNA 2-thiolation protein 2 n=1 Tax=Lachancea meyersii CBS 8951 TaxID=1266667 RepID=A0A1G4KE59_9SACH|nr:LAME_0H05424g1_1 [Lachancea meyersii CBS 8951]
MSEHQDCKRCRSEKAVLVSRKEPFCPGCFQKFISLKQRKQMMSEQYFQDVFKVMYQDKVKTAEIAEKMNAESRILVPLSFGSSSLVMLDVLNDTLKEQLEVHRGKTGFHVDILICFLGSEDLQNHKDRLQTLMNTRLLETRNCYKTHFVDLESFFSSSKRMRVRLEDSSYIVRKVDGASDATTEPTVKELLSTCVNRSAREDLLNVMKTATIKLFAAQHAYKAILWGHSMTRLADEIMALVVKGRAAQIANTLDNSSFDSEFDGSFKNLHPMRDILLSEIDAYCHISDLASLTYNYAPQRTLLIEEVPDAENSGSKLARNMTINELARQYFDNIEGNYANVISTVVRTGAKLDSPLDALPKMSRCGVCNARLFKDGSKWLRNITVTSSHHVESEEDRELYSAWADSEHGKSRGEYIKLNTEFKEQGEVLPTCYGCLLVLGEVRHKIMCWPDNQSRILQDTMEAYVIGDDDESN